MPYGFTVPIIGVLHPNCDYYVNVPFYRIGELLAVKDIALNWRLRLFHDGELKDIREETVLFKNKVPQSPPDTLLIEASETNWGENPGYYEYDFSPKDESNDSLIFREFLQPVSYAICSPVGGKNIFSTPSYKMAVPPVIEMVAAYGRYVECYPVVELDRQRDYGESIGMINPYNKNVKAEIVSSSGGRIFPIRVPKFSARYARLDQLLEQDKNDWRGQIQLTANNRIVTLDIKHSLSNPGRLYNEEHLDPFRADPTHLPALQVFRQKVGDALFKR
jgi:hypothetical protein